MLVNGKLHINDILPLFEESRVVITVAGFLFSSHIYGHLTPWRSGIGLPDGFDAGRIDPEYNKSTTLRQPGQNSEQFVGR